MVEEHKKVVIRPGLYAHTSQVTEPELSLYSWKKDTINFSYGTGIRLSFIVFHKAALLLTYLLGSTFSFKEIAWYNSPIYIKFVMDIAILLILSKNQVDDFQDILTFLKGLMERMKNKMTLWIIAIAYFSRMNKHFLAFVYCLVTAFATQHFLLSLYVAIYSENQSMHFHMYACITGIRLVLFKSFSSLLYSNMIHSILEGIILACLLPPVEQKLQEAWPKYSLVRSWGVFSLSWLMVDTSRIVHKWRLGLWFFSAVAMLPLIHKYVLRFKVYEKGPYSFVPTVHKFGKRPEHQEIKEKN